MKKIIATVLAMVMALALCTVAFADGTDYTATDATTTTKGYPAFHLEDGVYSFKVGNDYIKATDAQTAVLYNGGYYLAKSLKLNTKAADVTCTTAGYDCNIYKAANDKFYVADSELDAADITPTSTVFAFFGTSLDDATKYYEYDNVAAAEADVKVAAGHALYKTSDTFGVNKATVYACAICGKTFVKEADVNKVKDDVSKLGRINYTKGDGVESVLNSKGITLDKALTDTNVAMYQLNGTTTVPADTTKDNTSSPKTFDAGIAMYVGMALTSVAGSAVVIGKKKEF